MVMIRNRVGGHKPLLETNPPRPQFPVNQLFGRSSCGSGLGQPELRITRVGRGERSNSAIKMAWRRRRSSTRDVR